MTRAMLKRNAVIRWHLALYSNYGTVSVILKALTLNVHVLVGLLFKSDSNDGEHFWFYNCDHQPLKRYIGLQHQGSTSPFIISISKFMLPKGIEQCAQIENNACLNIVHKSSGSEPAETNNTI